MLNSPESLNMVPKTLMISKQKEELHNSIALIVKKFTFLTTIPQNMKDTFIICASLCIPLLTPIQILAFYFCPTIIII